MDKRVVITGVGAVTPLGADARTLHVRWCAGDSGIEDGAGLCRDFAPEDVLSRKLVRRTDGPVVGVHMVGARVGELVGEAQLIYGWEAHAEDVAPLVHAHPTQNEALGEAFLALAGQPLHAHG